MPWTNLFVPIEGLRRPEQILRKKAKSAKNKQRESASNDDMAIFNTSGFVAAPTSRTPPQPLPPASIEWIDRGAAAGEVVVKPKGLPKAISYELHYGLAANAGTPPATWPTLNLPGSKKVTISKSHARRDLCVSNPCDGPFGLH